MFSSIFSANAFLTGYETKQFVFAENLYSGVHDASSITARELPLGYQAYGRRRDDGCMLVVDVAEEARTKEKKIFLYSLDEDLLEGPIFTIGKGADFCGFVCGFVWLFERKQKSMRMLSVSSGQFVELPGLDATVLGSHGAVIVLSALPPGEERLVRVEPDGSRTWEISPKGAREALLFSDLNVIVCSVWHQKPNVPVTIYERCELLILDADDGTVVDTVRLGEMLAAAARQVVVDGNVIYARTNGALYAYDTARRETRRFTIPMVKDIEAFLVAEGKAYIPNNEDGNARVYVISLDDGSVLGSRDFQGLVFHEAGSKMRRFEHGFAMNLHNHAELPGWRYQRVISWRDREMEDPDAELTVEPLRVEKIRELVGRDSRYRIRMTEARPVEDVLRHMAVGIESAAYEAAISFDDSKPYDEDFAGELVVDLTNQTLNDEEQALVTRSVETIKRDQLKYLKNAVDQGPLKIAVLF